MDGCVVDVDAGVCKMRTRITAKQNDEAMVDLALESDCPYVLRMSWKFKPVNPYTEIEASMRESDVYGWASEELPHAACPVPCAIIKAVEVASDMGVKRDVAIRFADE